MGKRYLFTPENGLEGFPLSVWTSIVLISLEIKYTGWFGKVQNDLG